MNHRWGRFLPLSENFMYRKGRSFHTRSANSAAGRVRPPGGPPGGVGANNGSRFAWRTRAIRSGIPDRHSPIPHNVLRQVALGMRASRFARPARRSGPTHPHCPPVGCKMSSLAFTRVFQGRFPFQDSAGKVNSTGTGPAADWTCSEAPPGWAAKTSR